MFSLFYLNTNIVHYLGFMKNILMIKWSR